MTSRSRRGSTASARQTCSSRIVRDREVERRLGARVLDEVAERGVLLLADGPLERDGLLGHPLDLADVAGRAVQRRAISSALGSRPSSCTSWRSIPITLLSFSTMCTGMRIVRPLSAIARVTAWRIHHVA